MPSVKFELPRRVVPGYLHPYLGDHYDPQDTKTKTLMDEIPPGHRFLLYFHGLACKGESEDITDKPRLRKLRPAAENGHGSVWMKELAQGRASLKEEWTPLKSKKILSLSAVAGMGGVASKALKALNTRQDYFSGDHCWRRQAELTAPLLTGSGNPHPVENGFAFLSPYGVPYLAGSGIKGVLRKAAEELALLSEDSRGWTLPLVWVLFGFDANSAIFPNDSRSGDNVWAAEYGKFIDFVVREGDTILSEWISVLQFDQRPKSASEFLRLLRDSRSMRQSIHWQGLIAFEDAFPSENAQMGVDILNPHHKRYYQGPENSREGPEPPHDADQPIPVYFLVLKPGAAFTFRARAIAARGSLWERVGDWKALLDAAFEQACEWSGFGAKTTVGYGKMVPPEGQEQTVGIGSPELLSPSAAAPKATTLQETTETWENAVLKWTPNDGMLTVTHEDETKKTARWKVDDRSKVPEQFHKKLFDKKKTVQARVKVKVTGNLYEVQEILAD